MKRADVATNPGLGTSDTPPGNAMTQASTGRTWAVVLAAGEGERLATLTRDAEGIAVPKQFCSLSGGATLFQETLRRAHSVARNERVTAVVAEQHRRWWRGACHAIPRANMIVQPANRGTANGVLLSALSIALRDPLARVVFLPSDHYVRDEVPLAAALQKAAAGRLPAGELILLGFEPGEPDPQLGYIVPRGSVTPPALQRVGCFVEKPARSLAVGLLACGAVWNGFIFAAEVSTIVELVQARYPRVVEDLATAVACGPDAVAAAYDWLPTLDFSRDVLQGAEERLRVLRVPPCGWSDLGTPPRVAACLARLPSHCTRERRSSVSEVINLAAVCARLLLAASALHSTAASPKVGP